MRRALLTAISCIALSGVARAEPLPGEVEVSGGGHFMVLASESCESSGDVVGCAGASTFAGFDLVARLQVAEWLALGVRAAGSSELGATGVGSSAGQIERSLWLWQLAAEARFDPPLWPSGLWIGADIGAAFAVDSLSGIESGSNVESGFLIGGLVGWDFELEHSLLFGIDARVLYVALPELPSPSSALGTRTLDPFPYIALGAHVGARW